MRRLRTLLQTFRAAGGNDAVVLFHDGDHGDALIDALARFGDGLPANVLPLLVNEVTQLGPETIAAVFAYGGTGAALLARGQAEARYRRAEADDRDVGGDRVGARLRRRRGAHHRNRRSRSAARGARCRACRRCDRRGLRAFIPRGAKRGVLETTFRELHLAAPTPVDVVPLAAGAPFGGVKLNVEGCTLCHACVTACPTGALGDNPDRAMLRFTESLCVQCGLCEQTCPEDVITLEPRLDFKAWSAPPRVLKEEEPFHCIACGKPFGTKSSIERVLGKLGEKHWMFRARMRGGSTSSRCARIAGSRP